MIGAIEAGAGGFALGFVLGSLDQRAGRRHEIGIRRRLEYDSALDPLAPGGRMSGREASPRDVELIAGAVARLRAGIMALVFAFCGGLGLFLATVWLVVQGGRNVGSHLGLLSNYFPGYSRELGGLAAGSRSTARSSAA